MVPVRIVIARPPGGHWASIWCDLSFFVFRDLMGFVICLGLRWAYRHPIARNAKPLLLGPALVLLSGLAAVVDGWASEWIVLNMNLGRGNITASIFVAASFWLHLFIFFFWSVMFFILKAFMRSKMNERRLAQAAARQRESELLMLRAHLEPHFIFNALNAITILSHGNTQVIPVVRGLSDYLRFCLANRDKPLVPLGEELDAIDQYLKVERARFGDDLVVRMDVDDPISRNIPVPGVFMMPLVENAIKHRAANNNPLYLWIQVEHRRGAGDEAVLEELRMHPVYGDTHEQLQTSTSRETEALLFGAEPPDSPAMERELIIRVTSNSVWKEPEAREAASPASGVGLSNLQRRLELLYPGEGRTSFAIGPADGYVVAEIRIRAPLHAFRRRVLGAQQPVAFEANGNKHRDGTNRFIGLVGQGTSTP